MLQIKGIIRRLEAGSGLSVMCKEFNLTHPNEQELLLVPIIVHTKYNNNKDKDIVVLVLRVSLLDSYSCFLSVMLLVCVCSSV